MAVKGVDISEFNGSVDFQALKNAGVAATTRASRTSALPRM